MTSGGTEPLSVVKRWQAADIAFVVLLLVALVARWLLGSRR